MRKVDDSFEYVKGALVEGNCLDNLRQKWSDEPCYYITRVNKLTYVRQYEGLLCMCIAKVCSGVMKASSKVV